MHDIRRMRNAPVLSVRSQGWIVEALQVLPVRNSAPWAYGQKMSLHGCPCPAARCGFGDLVRALVKEGMLNRRPESPCTCDAENFEGKQNGACSVANKTTKCVHMPRLCEHGGPICRQADRSY